MIKTAVENQQNLIVEGCYIPFAWKNYFEKEYLEQITYICLVMTEHYIRNHFDDIKKYANVIENQLDDGDCTMDNVLRDNAFVMEQCRKYQVDYIQIEEEYKLF